MKEIESSEFEQVNGGIVPLVIIAAKGFAAGLTIGAASYGLYFAVRNSD